MKFLEIFLLGWKDVVCSQDENTAKVLVQNQIPIKVARIELYADEGLNGVYKASVYAYTQHELFKMLDDFAAMTDEERSEFHKEYDRLLFKPGNTLDSKIK